MEGNGTTSPQADVVSVAERLSTPNPSTEEAFPISGDANPTQLDGKGGEENVKDSAAVVAKDFAGEMDLNIVKDSSPEAGVESETKKCSESENDSNFSSVQEKEGNVEEVLLETNAVDKDDGGGSESVRKKRELTKKESKDSSGSAATTPASLSGQDSGISLISPDDSSSDAVANNAGSSDVTSCLSSNDVTGKNTTSNSKEEQLKEFESDVVCGEEEQEVEGKDLGKTSVFESESRGEEVSETTPPSPPTTVVPATTAVNAAASVEACGADPLLQEKEGTTSSPSSTCAIATNNATSTPSTAESHAAENLSVSDKEKEKESSAVPNTDAAAGALESGEATATGVPKDQESVYYIKWIMFNQNNVPIITQNENGPCPLLAIINVLLLNGKVKLAPMMEMVTSEQLMTYLGDCILEGRPQNLSETTQANYEQNMQDAMGIMFKLQTGLDVNVKFSGVGDFEYTPECIIFDLLEVGLYHGWLVDPQDADTVTAVGAASYNQLVESIIALKSSSNEDDVRRGLIAEQFLDGTASQLTYHGLCEMASAVKEKELCVFFRNNHFNTLYKHNNELFVLVTDQGFLTESHVVWETLSNVEGDGHFVDANFRTYTRPSPPPQSSAASSPLLPASDAGQQVPVGSPEQIDHDYQVALSLQVQEEDPQPSPTSEWPADQDARTKADHELAMRLQEQEHQSALNQQQQQQQHQQQQQQQQRQQQPPNQSRAWADPQQGGQARGASSSSGSPQEGGRRRGEDTREKESKCSIL